MSGEWGNRVEKIRKKNIGSHTHGTDLEGCEDFVGEALRLHGIVQVLAEAALQEEGVDLAGLDVVAVDLGHGVAQVRLELRVHGRVIALVLVKVLVVAHDTVVVIVLHHHP